MTGFLKVKHIWQRINICNIYIEFLNTTNKKAKKKKKKENWGKDMNGKI